MKALLLIRHSKTTGENADVSDVDRTLTERGIDNSYKMAYHINKKEIKPDLVLSSHAIRSVHTATIIINELRVPFERLLLKEELYLADEETILNCISSADDSINTIFLVGHNPGITECANNFLSVKTDNIPTTGIVLLIFNTSSWNEISMMNKVAEWYDFPGRI